MLKQLTAVLMSLVLVFFTASASGMSNPQKGDGKSGQSALGRDKATLQDHHTFLQRSVADRFNTMQANARQGRLHPADIEAVASSMDFMIRAYISDGTFDIMEKEIKLHHQEYLDFVPNPSNVAQMQKMFHAQGFTEITDEDIYAEYTKPAFEKRLSLERLEKHGAVRAALESTSRHFSEKARAMRSNPNPRYLQAAFPPPKEEYTICLMMGDVGGGFGILALFGCIPCGFASGIAFGAHVACRYYNW